MGNNKFDLSEDVIAKYAFRMSAILMQGMEQKFEMAMAALDRIPRAIRNPNGA